MAEWIVPAIFGSFFLILILRGMIIRRIEEARHEYESKKIALQKEFEDKKQELLKSLKSQFTEVDTREKRVEKKEKEILTLLSSRTPFRYSASLVTEIEGRLDYDFEKQTFYNYKTRRFAHTAADKVKAALEEKRDALRKYREMKYKYEFLLSVFPELKQYAEDEDDETNLLGLAGASSIDEFKADYDYASDYLSDHEWSLLSVSERNQRALDRWKKADKSKWWIGTLYELQVLTKLQKASYKVDHFGEKKKLEDLGRDLIAKRQGKTYIVQCKNWSQEKEIHENVICQLYGTTIEYELSNPGEQVVPVICSTTNLSDMARRFAERLGCIIKIIPMDRSLNFPLIKCNISRTGEKIYHLPFDQQYTKTRIDKPGEFYAMTVQEAENAGFRRAYKYNKYKTA